MATTQEAGDFGSRLARVLRRWRDEEEPQRLAEWQRRRQQPDDVDGGYAFTSDDGNMGQWVEENVPRVDLVAKYRLAFADRDTTNQPWTMDDDDDDENESTDDTMSLSDEESDSNDALGDKQRTSRAMVISSRSGYYDDGEGEPAMETSDGNGEAAAGMSAFSRLSVATQAKSVSPPRKEEGELNQHGSELVTNGVRRKDGGRDSLSNIWAPSLMT
jgi:hypothetical protein